MASSSGEGARAQGGPRSGVRASSRARKVGIFAACVGKELGSDQDSWQHAEAVQTVG